MLDTIGESAVRTTTRIDHNPAAQNKDDALKKIDKVVEERPVENAQENAKADTNTGQKTSGYDMDKRGIFYEKYDKKGNLLYRIPPKKMPIDEHV
jgi:hypothetical protein